MKNLSFGKLLAIFAGFLLICGIGAFVAMKYSAKPPLKKVVAVKPQTPQAQPQELPDPSQFPVQTQPLASPEANQGVPQVSMGIPAPADIGQRLASIDSKQENIINRVAAIEGALATKATACPPESKPAKVTATKTIKRKKAPSEEEKTAALPAMDGYKSMAVVGKRSWIAAPDGTEDSGLKGDPIPVPAPRIRVVRDDGIVITSSDQRIDARVPQPQQPIIYQRPGARNDQYRGDPQTDRRFDQRYQAQ